MDSIMLLSGGLDSAVSLAAAVERGKVRLAITFDYGQRAASHEISAARQLAEHFNVLHHVIRLPFLHEITRTALVNRAQAVPRPERNVLNDVTGAALDTAAKVWVPNRNGVFVNIAAAHAEAMDCDFVVTGFNREEAATFPDNSPAFIAAANNALAYSTLKKVRVVSFTQDLTKKDIVRLGQRLGVPFPFIWSCYHGEEIMCGSCESCQRLKRALEEAGGVDGMNFAE